MTFTANFANISLNQIYHFPSSNGHGTYAGFCVVAGTFGGTYDKTTTTNNGEGGQATTTTRNRQSTVTRIGGGLILGANVSNKMYREGRYEWYDKHKAVLTPEGLRVLLGFRF